MSDNAFYFKLGVLAREIFPNVELYHAKIHRANNPYHYFVMISPEMPSFHGMEDDTPVAPLAYEKEEISLDKAYYGYEFLCYMGYSHKTNTLVYFIR